MTNPAVVILTDPAHCELADADALLQALLQVQQLNSAGVPASQTFCDHPAAAMEFIDAYTTAYPELQQQSSGLPLPEVLHTMVADGRFGPLLAPGPGEPGEPQEASQLDPLYVLSLGAPETLIQAMQHNPMAKNNIRVLEVAPIEHPTAESVRVAEAVAHEPPARSSRLSESPTTLQSETEEALSLEAMQDSEPLKLDGVEVNLDHIQVGTNDHQKYYDQNGARIVGPEPTFAAILPAGSGVADGVALANLSGEAAPAASVGSVSPAFPPTPVPASVLDLAAKTLSTSPIESAVATGTAPYQSGSSYDIATVPDIAPLIDAERPPSGGAGTPAGGQAAGEPPEGAPQDQTPTAGGSGMENNGLSSAQSENGSAGGNGSQSGAVPGPEEAPVAISGCVDEQEAGAAPAGAFADPGEDVLYPPTGNFAWSNDLPYGLPGESIPEINPFENPFDMADHAEVVDLEALYRDLQASSDTSAPTVERFDFASLRVLTPNGPNPSDPASNPTPHGTAPPCEAPDPPHDEVHHEALVNVHDADL